MTIFSTGLEKQLNILDYALASFWRRKLKNLSVMIVFGAVIFLLASFQMVTRSLTETAADVLAAAPDITVQRLSAGRQESLPLAYRDRLAAIFGIRKVVPRIWGYLFDEGKGANYTIMGLDVAAMPGGEKLPQSLAAGRFPEPDETGGCVVGRSIVRIQGLESRRHFSLFRPDLSLKPFRVTGTFGAESAILTDDLIVTTLPEAADLFAIPAGLVTDLCVYVVNPREIDTIAKKIAARLPDSRVLTRSQILKTYQVVFGWRSGFASICLLTGLLAFIILAWDKASGLSPEERREIGILKVLGWETADILTIRFWEGCLIAALSYVLGVTAAYIHVVHFNAALFRPVMLGWSVLDPTFRLVPVLEAADLLLIFCLTVLPYLAATVVPAWRCAIVPADSAIRGG